MKRIVASALAVMLIALVPDAGCVNVRAPDVYIDAGPPPEDVNSARVPATSSHEEAQTELAKAYRHIRYLEHENHRLAEKLEDQKARAEEYKSKYKRIKKKYDD